MPIAQEKLDRFEEIYHSFSNAAGKLSKSDFKRFLNSFVVSVPANAEEEESDVDMDNITKAISLVGADYYDSKSAIFIFQSFDIKNEGEITKDIAFFCIRGLSGYFQDFSMKVYFRALDINRENRVYNNELRKMQKIMAIPGSEDDMIKKFEKRLGKEIDYVDYSTFYYCFKHRQIEEHDTAYDPEIFGNVQISDGSGGCCLIQ